MKAFAIALLPLTLLGASTFAQEMPSAPAPAPDPAWSRLENLRNGQAIVVTTVDNRSFHCLFAGVTDAYLFCNPPGNPPDTGFRVDHAEVLSVDLDWPGQTPPKESSQRNYHPRWIASIIAGGIIVGVCATRTNDAGTSARAGIIGAGVVGLIGAPFAFLPLPQSDFATPAYPQYGFGLPIRFKPPQRIRRIPILRTPR